LQGKTKDKTEKKKPAVLEPIAREALAGLKMIKNKKINLQSSSR
jgi:hypothetical protein